MPAHSRVRVAIKPRFGDPDLAVYTRSARGIAERSALLARSQRGAGRSDRLTVRNRAGASRTYYVRIYVHGGSSRLDSAYVLRVQRLR